MLIVYKKKVYNMFKFLDRHPGGKMAILGEKNVANSEYTINRIHQNVDRVLKTMEKFYVADLAPEREAVRKEGGVSGGKGGKLG